MTVQLYPRPQRALTETASNMQSVEQTFDKQSDVMPKLCKCLGVHTVPDVHLC